MRLLRAVLIAVFLSVSPATCGGDELLIFSADWCKNCQQLKAAIEANPTLVDGYEVVIIDLDDNPELAKSYKVASIPALLHLQPEGKIRRKIGFKNAAELKRWLEEKNERTSTLRKVMRYRLD